MRKSKKQIKKDNLRYLKEKVSKCGDCRFFTNQFATRMVM